MSSQSKCRSRIVLPLCAILMSSTAWVHQVDAQVTEVSRTPVADASRLTFGYLCDDRFVVRNDGSRPLDLEYSVEKSNEHAKLRLNERESVELASPSKEALELWMDGKLIAKAIKDKRSCKDVQGNASVMVAPLEVVTNERPTRASYPYGYGAPYPYYDPWAYGFYGSLAFRPYYAGYIGLPIVVGGPRGGGRRR